MGRVLLAAGTHGYQYNNPGGAFSRETIAGGMLDGLELDVLNGGVDGQRTSFSASRARKVLRAAVFNAEVCNRLAGAYRRGILTRWHENFHVGCLPAMN